VIEAIRKKFNPEQYALIKSHVTLCREDELKDIDKVLENLHQLKVKPISITFDDAKRFSEEKGVLIPAKAENSSFDILRSIILNGVIDNPKKQEPHITLMHPRNSTCTNVIFDEIKRNPFPKEFTFDTISLIKQELGKKWSTITEFKLES